MQIILQGQHNTEEAAESLVSILQLFQEKYGISDFKEIKLNMTLVDQHNKEVELIDADTEEVLGIFEVYRNFDDAKAARNNTKTASHLRLAVDNTK